MLFTALKPMLLETNPIPPSGSWIHQLKLDGFRCLAHIHGNKVALFTRHQNDVTQRFSEFTGLQINADSAIVDAEMIAFDKDGRPDWELVMSRFQSTRKKVSIHTHLAAFDVLLINGKSVMHEPIEKRLEMLQEIIVPSDRISVVQSHTDGQALFETTKKLNLEGLVSKKARSIYRLDKRSPDWRKVKHYEVSEVAIMGVRKREFAWSLQFLDGQYAGVCEFVPPDARKAFYQIAEQLIRSENQNWLHMEPLIRCKVKSQGRYKSGLLRTPSFVEFTMAT